MRIRELGAFISLALIWGTSFLFIKIAVREVPPTILVAGRLTCAVLVLSIVAVARPALFAGWRRFWRLCVLVGIVNNVLPYLLISWGETKITSGAASILNACIPLFTALLAHWWIGPGHEPLTIRRVVGVLLGFVGVGTLVGPGAFGAGHGGLAALIGAGAVLIAALSYAVGAMLTRRFAGVPMLVGPLTSQSAGLVLILLVVPFGGLPTQLPSFKAIGAIAILGTMGTATALLLAFWLTQQIGPMRTSLVAYLFPCTALIWGFLFLGEAVSWNALLGLCLVLLGTMITNGLLTRKKPAVIIPDQPASLKALTTEEIITG